MKISMTEKNINITDIDALDRLILGSGEKFTFVSGSTDLMVNPTKWNVAENLVNINRVESIRDKIEIENDSLVIGAAVPFTRIIKDARVQKYFPIIVEACRQIGSVQIQNRASIGGNIANASPAGDSLPVLTVLGATLLLGPREGGNFQEKRIDEVMLGPGQNSLAGNRYIAFIKLPLPAAENYFWYYRKVGQRYSMAISKLSLAVKAQKSGQKVTDIAVCAGSVSPQIKRAAETESILRGKVLDDKLIEEARMAFLKEISPITDIRSTAEFRKHISGEVFREALYSLMKY